MDNTNKSQFIKDMNTTDVKKLTVAGGVLDGFKRLVRLCPTEQEIHDCKKALLRFIKDYEDERFIKQP